MTPSGIEPATFQLSHRLPPSYTVMIKCKFEQTKHIINKQILKLGERIFSIRHVMVD